jgi:hypothetical protein
MRRAPLPGRLAAGWLFLVIGIAACGGRSFDYQPVGDIPKGPAVFSDQTDGHVIYNSDDQKAEKKAKPPEPGLSAEQQAEFEAFQEWKKSRAEFEEFRQWKALNKDSEEYRQFRQWLEWKQYQQWKQSQ